MKTLFAKAQAWFDGRTVREQRMLAVMLAVIVLCAVWLLIIQPLWSWKAEAADRRARAQTDLAYVTTQTSRAEVSSTTVSGPPIEPLALQTAEAARLTITTGMDEAGAFGFRAANTSSAALFGWLAELKTGHGIDAIRLDIVENADATVTAEGALSR
jgi:general secretion pathway protein M